MNTDRLLPTEEVHAPNVCLCVLHCIPLLPVATRLCNRLTMCSMQIGDADSATALAHMIAANDPNNTLAQQVIRITAAPSAAHALSTNWPA